MLEMHFQVLVDEQVPIQGSIGWARGLESDENWLKTAIN